MIRRRNRKDPESTFSKTNPFTRLFWRRVSSLLETLKKEQVSRDGAIESSLALHDFVETLLSWKRPRPGFPLEDPLESQDLLDLDDSSVDLFQNVQAELFLFPSA